VVEILGLGFLEKKMKMIAALRRTSEATDRVRVLKTFDKSRFMCFEGK